MRVDRTRDTVTVTMSLDEAEDVRSTLGCRVMAYAEQGSKQDARAAALWNGLHAVSTWYDTKGEFDSETDPTHYVSEDIRRMLRGEDL